VISEQVDKSVIWKPTLEHPFKFFEIPHLNLAPFRETLDRIGHDVPGL